MAEQFSTLPVTFEAGAQPARLALDRIGPYRIEGQLGGGGMGVVFRARDTRLERYVAIKTIRPDSLNSSTRAAFRREAQLASSLNHPGIVTIYDILTHQDMDCIVMEFIDGVPLRTRIADRTLAASDCLTFARSIGDALGAAHRAGIVHRDLKPGNIMVTRDNRIKIVDFGLSVAKRAHADDDETRSRSIFSGLVGTLAYMAPEHAQGKVVDHRADIFALTIIVHEMLTGKLPFSAPNPAALMRALLWDEPALPSSVRAELAAFDALIHRGLRKDPDLRYQDVAELLADLPAIAISGQIAPAQPDHTHSNSSFSSRQITSGAFATGLSVPPAIGSERASIAVLPFTSLSKDPDDIYLAAGLASELISALTGLPGLRIAPQVAAHREQERGSDPIAAAHALNTRYVLTGSLRRSSTRIRVSAELTDGFAETVVWTRNYDRPSADIFEVQEEIARSIVKSLGGQLIRAATAFAFQTPTGNLSAWGLSRKAYHIWNYQFSVEGVREAIDLCRRAIQLDPGYSSAQASLAVYLIQSVIHAISASPEADTREAMAAADRALSLAPEDTEVLAATAIVFIHTSQFERAVVNLRRAARVAPYDLVPWGYLGFALACAGKQAELEESVRILQHLIQDAPDHPSLPYWYQFLAIATLRTGDFETAITSAQRAVEMQPGFVFNQVFLAEALCRAGRPQEAQKVIASIQRYNPAFTLAAFEAVAISCCREQEHVEQLCAQVRNLGML